MLLAFAQDFGLAEYLEESTIGNEDIASTYTDIPEVEYEQSNIEMAESSLLNILKDKEEAIIDDARQKEHLIGKWWFIFVISKKKYTKRCETVKW